MGNNSTTFLQDITEVKVHLFFGTRLRLFVTIGAGVRTAPSYSDQATSPRRNRGSIPRGTRFNSSPKCQGICKGTVHPRTGHEDTEGEKRYSYTISLTSAKDGVGGQRHAPADSPLGKRRYPLCRRLGGLHSLSGEVRKISPPPGFDPKTVQPVARRYYRLRYPGSPQRKDRP